MSSQLHCLGALAVELAPAAGLARTTLDRTAADALAGLIAFDLQRLLPGIDALDGVFAGALFDPAELLRPGWPVHAGLIELAQAVPGARGSRVIAFGTADGEMPVPSLQPDPGLEGGPLRLLPFVLVGDERDAQAVGQAMEEKLLDTGMTLATTALALQDAFGCKLEHARFMSIHDLCALVAVQYQHAGLEPVWRMIEVALLAPGATEWLREPGEPVAVHTHGTLRIADPDYAAWEAQYLPQPVDRADYQRSRMRLRQWVSILAAHGIPTDVVPVTRGEAIERALLPSTM